MKNVVYRRLPDRRSRAIATAKTAPQIPTPVLALAAFGTITLLVALALRGLL